MSFGASISAKGDIVETKLHRDGIEMHCNEVSLICPCNEVISALCLSYSLPHYVKYYLTEIISKT